MKDMLIALVGEVWDMWMVTEGNRDLLQLWNTYLCGHWANFSIGDEWHIPNFTPNNNTQESWHHQLVLNLSDKMLTNMSRVIHTTLPHLLWVDEVNMPDVLSEEVQAESTHTRPT